jgi:hypothetical protein
MVAIMVVIAVLVAVAVGAGILSRRRAAERERVERERRIIAGELAGQRPAAERAEARFERAHDAAARHDEGRRKREELEHHR